MHLINDAHAFYTYGMLRNIGGMAPRITSDDANAEK